MLLGSAVTLGKKTLGLGFLSIEEVKLAYLFLVPLPEPTVSFLERISDFQQNTCLTGTKTTFATRHDQNDKGLATEI